MNLGACWQDGVWADGSWVEGTWCPDGVCTPVSIGECWAITWCSGTWVTNAWCPDGAIPPTPTPPQIFGSVPVQANYHLLLKLMREDEEIVIL